jgi:hypothetical protein
MQRQILNIIACVVLCTLFSNTVQAQQKEYKINTIAFYNLENLFDTVDDPNKDDHQNPIGEMSEGEAARVYPLKIKNMAKVIADIGTAKSGYPPAVIGVCEIENYKVLEDLVNHPRLSAYNYGILHYESPDRRSIDVALLYRKDIFRPLFSKPHEVVLYNYGDRSKRSYTRDVLYVKGMLDGEEMHFLINHWPSRGGGEKKSRPRRVEAAKVAKSVIDSVQLIDPNAKIMLMGDLNDGVYNESVKEILKTKENKTDLKLPTDVWNPYEAIFKEGIGTIAWRDSWDLFDHIIITQQLTVDTDFSSYRFYQAGVFNPPYLRNPRGRWKGYPFRSFANSAWTNGYSDHFPVYIYLIKEI